MSESNEQAGVVLAADDDDDILELVCLTLEQVGHTMIRASDGDEALALAREHKPDVCVLDVVMPSRTGIEVVEALRGSEETAAIPILLLTATVNEKDLIPGIEKDSERYMRKPFSPRELQERVATLLRSR
jgi:two-component system, OmpR family, alkaline phosphatase synthesis response regulator PhoP